MSHPGSDLDAPLNEGAWRDHGDPVAVPGAGGRSDLRDRPWKARWAGLLAGLVAALLMTLVMALLRFAWGISPSPEAIPDRLAPAIDVNPFLKLLGLFGGYNQAKQFGVGSILAGQLLLGALIGLLYAEAAEHERACHPERTISRRAVARVGVLIGLLWLGSVVLLGPVLGSTRVTAHVLD